MTLTYRMSALYDTIPSNPKTANSKPARVRRSKQKSGPTTVYRADENGNLVPVRVDAVSNREALASLKAAFDADKRFTRL